MLALLALALSAWVKWKPAAGGLMFGVFFVASAFGAVINAVQRTHWGNLFNISYLVGVDLGAAFRRRRTRPPTARSSSARPRRGAAAVDLLGGLGVLALLCLYMLARKIRGAEVVR